MTRSFLGLSQDKGGHGQDPGRSPSGAAAASSSSYSSRTQIQEMRLAKELSGLEPIRTLFSVEEVDGQIGTVVVTVPNSCILSALGDSASSPSSKEREYLERSLEPGCNGVSFQISPSAQFPFSPPIIHCLTRFSFPSLCDGRNLARDILRGGPWNPAITFHAIVEKRLPRFVARVLRLMADREHGDRENGISRSSKSAAPLPLLFGTFEGVHSLMRFWRDENCAVFPCLKACIASGECVYRVAVLTESALVLFFPTDFENTHGTVTTFFHLSLLRAVAKKPSEEALALRIVPPRPPAGGGRERVITLVFGRKPLVSPYGLEAHDDAKKGVATLRSVEFPPRRAFEESLLRRMRALGLGSVSRSLQENLAAVSREIEQLKGDLALQTGGPTPAPPTASLASSSGDPGAGRAADVVKMDGPADYSQASLDLSAVQRLMALFQKKVELETETGTEEQRQQTLAELHSVLQHPRVQRTLETSGGAQADRDRERRRRASTGTDNTQSTYPEGEDAQLHRGEREAAVPEADEVSQLGDTHPTHSAEAETEKSLVSPPAPPPPPFGASGHDDVTVPSADAQQDAAAAATGEADLPDLLS
uniref:Uncharacterized protein n=1 Tax=Chromera velia CCMP2878 TaxID=1169474 RepID=A0A0G4FEE8_9ALVE|mmetsp:Transcript_55276/g.108136  ORF Transcript_55276/g.108136 Transcript_55276/m.108136 type:complete len:593 (-) Transcript_55276:124-1902(-)|eukprot:Cvel_16507.t1-p1 / transcript=Cvel_16507.t1 / gene=Cvel_16507 / organism=Chromera_velia_CCMP2878 / gene_product=hypothetical protein / transcript_product=hypothetical protein / location=Cvel_scaffold1273:23959-29300(+) / protein_length=592 / sequence_SO=supercontig / SO=protein_coding / is_pseudo=false